MQISISIKPSLEALANAIGAVDVKGFMRDEIVKLAYKIERNAKQLTPVKTGYLRSSIATSVLLQGIGARIGTNTNYAVYVHEGTRYMRARPFMTTAAEITKGQTEGDIPKRIDQEFAKAFKKL